MQIIGVDTLGGIKGLFSAQSPTCVCNVCAWHVKDGRRQLADSTLPLAEPELHYELLRQHVQKLRDFAELRFSQFLVLVERNLGFESEHIKRASEVRAAVVVVTCCGL